MGILDFFKSKNKREIIEEKLEWSDMIVKNMVMIFENYCIATRLDGQHILTPLKQGISSSRQDLHFTLLGGDWVDLVRLEIAYIQDKVQKSFENKNDLAFNELIKNIKKYNWTSYHENYKKYLEKDYLKKGECDYPIGAVEKKIKRELQKTDFNFSFEKLKINIKLKLEEILSFGESNIILKKMGKFLVLKCDDDSKYSHFSVLKIGYLRFINDSQLEEIIFKINIETMKRKFSIFQEMKYPNESCEHEVLVQKQDIKEDNKY